MIQSDQYCAIPQLDAPSQATWEDDLFRRGGRGVEEALTNRSPAGFQHHWPQVVGGSHNDQNPMGCGCAFIGPQGSVNGWSQSVTPYFVDERVEEHNEWPIQGYQHVEQQEVSENSNGCGYQFLSNNDHGHSAVGNILQHPHAEHNNFIYQGPPVIEQEEGVGINTGFQKSVLITPPRSFSDMVNFSDESPIHVSNFRSEAVLDIDTAKDLHVGGRQPPTLGEKMKCLSSRKYLDENMQHILDPTLHTDPFLMSNLLTRPASTYDHHTLISSARADPQSLRPQPGLDFESHPQEMAAVRPVLTTQPHISKVDAHGEGEENDPHNAHLDLPISSHTSQHLNAYQFHSKPSIMPQPRKTGIGSASQQQADRPPRNKFSTPISTPDPNVVLRGQSTPDLQHSLLNGVNVNFHLLPSRNEQTSKLRAESLQEIQLHLKILTSYFSHVRRHGFVHISPAHAAVEHWIECAKRWESDVPEEWKARLPGSPPRANAIQGMLYRQIRVQVMIERERCEDAGLEPQLPDDDIHITAFREQLKLMKTWTLMFSDILDELQFNFPLLEDRWQGFQDSGDWTHHL